jgi:8-oxo-dGTP pyrophosphatase MutT (NUDIX family)
MWRNVKKKYDTPVIEKSSYGVACCRYNQGGKMEMLTICKRHSYSLFLIVLGKYNPYNSAAMIRLLSGTTLDEKHDLLSLNFAQISYRVWLDKPVKNNIYFMAKNKFESAFAVDKGVRLRKLICCSGNSKRVWEIPKGRKKNKYEQDLQCAIREFYEETHVPRSSYKLYINATRTYSYIDDNTRYTNKYFIAYTTHNIEPWIDFKSYEQLSEIGDIKWMTIEEMRIVDPSGRLPNIAKHIFNYVRKHSKK